MKTENNSHKNKWILIISGYIVFQVGAVYFLNNKWLFHISLFALSIAIISSLFIMFKSNNKKTEDLKRSDQKLNHIFDTLDVAIWSHDLRTNTLLITPGIEKLYGYSLEEFYKDNMLWKKVIFPEDLPILAERELKLKQGEPATSIYRITRPDGEVRWIQDRGIPLCDGKGEIADFSSVLLDITDKKESEDRYRSLVEMSPDIIAVVSNGKIDYINEAGSKLVGANSPFDLIGKSIQDFVSTQAIIEIKDQIRKLDNRDEEKIRFETQAISLNGHTIEVEMSIMPIIYEGRPAKQVVGRDITDRKTTEKTIEYMAFYDELTGLPNRNMFRNRLKEALENPENTVLAVLFLDLDRFKIINDTKGHTTGDLVLKSVAERLAIAVQNKGLVSRQSGDEFIVLLENYEKEKVIEVAQRILVQFSNPFLINGDEFFVTTSIGISMFPIDGDDQETIIKHADTAMYLAKERGKNNYQFYTSNLNRIALRKMELENALRKAVEQDQLSLHYQPQIDITTGRIVGVEALVRWQHPELGTIPPCEFIPLAEETGLIVKLGKWILRTAVEQNKAWQETGFTPIPVAVNISVRQLQDDHFVRDVNVVLEQTKLDPCYLELEITESIMQNIEQSSLVLNKLKQLGLKLSIDDFGTGYSSFSYLKHLPIDSIKIDKSFVDDILIHSNKGSIVKTIIDMGHNLNFTVIAEGIEKEEQATFLKEYTCEIGQGYFYSKPLPPELIEPLLRSGKIDVRK
ncbi:EAL and GGDEF domain-containing protein [Bacillus sp. DJP31]|uniref:sensor domain-containing protein n=1 Tax=Bacillus sp. DJP31 TaxID=3409789 RepID=UPI003BB706EF